MSKKGLKTLLIASIASFPHCSDGPSKLEHGSVPRVDQQVAEMQTQVKDQVYLTIDDGPTPYTQEIAEMLSELGHKATFFFIGKNISERHYLAIQHTKNLGHSF